VRVNGLRGGDSGGVVQVPIDRGRSVACGDMPHRLARSAADQGLGFAWPVLEQVAGAV